MRLSFRNLWKGIDNWGQIHQRFVDVAALLQSFSSTLFSSLRSSQINKIKLSTFGIDNSIFAVPWLYLHSEDWVWSWARLIIKCWANMPWFRSFVQNIHNLFTSTYCFLCYTLDINSFPCILSQLEICIAFIQQVDDLLVVYLEKGATNYEYDSLRSLFINTLKKILHSPWN